MKLLALSLQLLVMSAVYGAPELVPWSWNTEMPSQLQSKEPRAHRTAAEAEAFFHQDRGGGLMLAEVLRYFGTPEGFSPQFIGTRAKGSVKKTEQGGTLRYVLNDGGEFHVWTGDLMHVHTVMRFGNANEAYLLYK